MLSQQGHLGSQQVVNKPCYYYAASPRTEGGGGDGGSSSIKGVCRCLSLLSCIYEKMRSKKCSVTSEQGSRIISRDRQKVGMFTSTLDNQSCASLFLKD